MWPNSYTCLPFTKRRFTIQANHRLCDSLTLSYLFIRPPDLKAGVEPSVCRLHKSLAHTRTSYQCVTKRRGSFIARSSKNLLIRNVNNHCIMTRISHVRTQQFNATLTQIHSDMRPHGLTSVHHAVSESLGHSTCAKCWHLPFSGLLRGVRWF